VDEAAAPPPVSLKCVGMVAERDPQGRVIAPSITAEFFEGLGHHD